MKIKKYLSKTIVILILIGLGMFIYTRMPYGQVVKNSKAVLEPGNWKPVIAKTVNKSVIIANVDAKQLKSTINGVYMDEGLALMIPLEYVRDAFDCAVNQYSTYILIEKGTSQLYLYPESGVYALNGEDHYQENAVIRNDDKVYCSAEVICAALSYSYAFDMNTNQATITNMKPEERTIPYAYNYEWMEKVPEVLNQGKLGTCWAFAALTALETTLMPKEKYNFSVDHMTMSNSFSVGQNEGGNNTMSMAYLLAWQGPVLEEDDPYGDGVTDPTLTAVKHVQEIQLVDSKDLETIKKMVFKYGGVQSSFYCSDLSGNIENSRYYNPDTYGYCYIGSEKSNHEIVIIGWDDNYSKNNFNMEIEGDGAFICRNSWGKRFGNDGDFYISYYDSNVAVHNAVYTRVEDANNYDNIYQSDLCGYVGELGYYQESAFFANAYTSVGNENISAVGFYATGRDTEYSIYFIENFTDGASLSKRSDPVVTGKFQNAGFYTVKLDTPISVKAGQKYAIIVRVTTPNAERPVAVEYADDGMTKDADIADGEGYISLKGTNWEHVEEAYFCNMCLKVYTKDANIADTSISTEKSTENEQ